MIDENGQPIQDDNINARLLNEYFSSVFTVENVNNLPAVSGSHDSSEVLCNIDISQEVVFQKLCNLRPDKAPGVDGIYPVVLRNLAKVVSLPLSIIFSKSLQCNQIPVDWKMANVTPLYKKGPKNQPSSYRPVSLTSQVCKVMESILKDSIVSYLERNNIIADSQHGFRSQRSCLTNLLYFLEVVTGKIDEGHPVDVVYLDFSKAFDKVPHKRLILKVKAHGIHSVVADWIQNWLDNRLQRVVLNGHMSDWLPVTSGVPQGSVLGPTLFIIYINDLDVNLNNSVLKFADDTKVFSDVLSVDKVAELQEDLDMLYKWSCDWQMLFNAQKCKCLHIGHSNAQASYFVGGVQVEDIEYEKDLGVLIDKSLSPSRQCAKAVNSANKVLGIINRTYDCKSSSNIIRLYKSLVRPHLEYCCQAWRPYLQKDIDNIEKVQRRATKLIPELSTLSYEQRLERTGLVSLEMRRLRADLIEVFKIVKGLEKVDQSVFFNLSEDSRTRGHQLKFQKHYCRLDVRKYFFSQRIITEWNNLPQEAITAKIVNSFKNIIDPILWKRRGLYIQ